MSHYWSLLLTSGAILVALGVLLRQLRGVAAAITFIASLPADYKRLSDATAANTEAIAQLTIAVNRLEAAERLRRR